MSDFLNNLVERTLSATDAVRPRTLSIFEPPPTNGGAFFRDSEDTGLHAIEHHDVEPADRLSQLQSLWRAGSPEPVADQFVPASPKTDPASLQFPSAPPLVPDRADPSRGPRERATPTGPANVEQAKTGKEESDSSRTESPGVLGQTRPGVDVRAEDQRVARPSRERAAPNQAERDEEAVDSSRSELPGLSPPIRPPLTRKQRAAVSSPEPRGSADEARVTPQVRRQADDPGKQPRQAHSRPRRTERDSADDKDAGEIRTQLPSGQAPSPRESALRNPAHKHRDELDPEKSIALGARERGLQRELVPGRDVRTVSPRPPSSRIRPATRPPKDPPAAPSINVTIGRIEVRATLPARGPTPAPRATSPIMNLEDYLRQRAAGNRP